MLAGRSHGSDKKVVARFRSFQSLANALNIEVIEGGVDVGDASGESLLHGVGRRGIVVTGVAGPRF